MCGLRGSSVFTVLFWGVSLSHMLHALNKERFNRIVKRCQRSREVARSAEQNNWGSCEAFVLLGSYSRASLARDSFPCVIIVALTLLHSSLHCLHKHRCFHSQLCLRYLLKSAERVILRVTFLQPSFWGCPLEIIA